MAPAALPSRSSSSKSTSPRNSTRRPVAAIATASSCIVRLPPLPIADFAAGPSRQPTGPGSHTTYRCAPANLLEPCKDSPQPIRQLHLRLPRQLAARPRHVQTASPHLAGTLRCELRVRQRPPVTDLAQSLEKIEHRSLLATADVDRPAEVGVRGHQVGADNIADVDPVSRLATVAVDGRTAPFDQVAAEDRHHSGLAVDI